MTLSANVRALIEKNNNKKGKHNDKVISAILTAISVISVLTILGILITSLLETITFFTRIPIAGLLFSTIWSPTGSDPKFDIRTLITGTLKVTVIATIFAVPVELGTVIYLGKYVGDRARCIIKSTLKTLTGMPTIVSGFSALTFVTSVLRSFIPGLGEFNAINPGLAVGIMIVPSIMSLSEDAMAPAPNKVQEGAYGPGAIKLEIATRVILPVATLGIVASIVLAISRAIEETMIVSLTAGSSSTASLSLTGSIQTIAGYIVEIVTGDATFGSSIYYSIYTVGLTLSIFTLIINLLSQWIPKRSRKEY